MKKKITVSVVVLLIISIVSFLFLKGNYNGSKETKKDLTFTEIKKEQVVDWDPTSEVDVKKHIVIKDKEDSDIPYSYKTTKINEGKYEVRVNAKDKKGKEISKRYVVRTSKGEELIEDEEENVDPDVYKDIPLVDGQPGNYDNKDGKLEIPEPIVIGEIDDVVTPKKVPDGFKLIKAKGIEDIYSYNQKLPGGGYIDEVIVSIGSVLFNGKDNKGEDLSVSYLTVRDVLMNTLGASTVTDADLDIMYELGKLMSDAYGEQMHHD